VKKVLMTHMIQSRDVKHIASLRKRCKFEALNVNSKTEQFTVTRDNVVFTTHSTKAERKALLKIIKKENMGNKQQFCAMDHKYIKTVFTWDDSTTILCSLTCDKPDATIPLGILNHTYAHAEGPSDGRVYHLNLLCVRPTTRRVGSMLWDHFVKKVQQESSGTNGTNIMIESVSTPHTRAFYMRKGAYDIGMRYRDLTRIQGKKKGIKGKDPQEFQSYDTGEYASAFASKGTKDADKAKWKFLTEEPSGIYQMKYVVTEKTTLFVICIV
jgi:hypothetical protein